MPRATDGFAPAGKTFNKRKAAGLWPTA